ncbi:MAG: MBL fold metallo-hydrolase [Desulfotomaculaceae bacterium]|nr:MBL fold metallo-hydrolase [Desulfotomaculaceae bacterium]
MLDIRKIYVPTPYQVGPVNCYLIMNRPFTLVDPGPESAEGREGLLAGLSDAGVRPDEIERVIITHWHADHCGLASWLSEQWGVQVYVHRLEKPKLTPGYDKHAERLPFLLEAGVPSSDLEEMLNDRDPLPNPLLPLTRVNLLEGGETLAFTGGALQVMHMPGHSTGHICLYDAESKIFLAGDFILAHITPNPFIAARPEDPNQRVQTLAQYLTGLNIMKDMDISLILTGHGENISDCPAVIAKVLDHRYKRMDVFSGILEGAVLSTYQVMRIMYPGIRGFDILLGISEVLAYMDYLEARGKVSHEVQDGVSLYRLSSSK